MTWLDPPGPTDRQAAAVLLSLAGLSTLLFWARRKLVPRVSS